MNKKNIEIAVIPLAFIFVAGVFLFGEDFEQMTDSEYYRAVFAWIIISIIAFIYSFVNLSRARLIEDIPTAKIRSAPQGYVEIEGKALPLPDKKLISPISKRECCWYSYKIRESDRIIEQGNSDGIPFLIQDDTGTCLIDPKRAVIETEHKEDWWESVTSGGKKKNLHYFESVLLENNEIYTVGFFQTLTDSDRKKKESQFSREILKNWKSNQEQLLQRFDKNNDGEVDLSEWEKAKTEASDEAAVKVAKMINEFPHRISDQPKPMRGQKFIISNSPQSDLVGSYRIRSRLGMFITACCILVIANLFTI